MPSPRAEFLSGVKAELPLLLGVAPFGMIYGVLTLSAGLPADAGLAMSTIVLAGSAQFVAVQLMGTATPGTVILLATFVINLRHVLYSASVAPHLGRLHPLWKGLLAYLLTDEVYAVAITHYQRREAWPSSHKHWYYLGAGLALWTTWQASTGLGLFLGTQVPASWGLDFALALTFIALIVPTLKDRAGVGAALAAGGIAVLAADLPFKLGLMLAALAGIGVGLLVEARHPSASPHQGGRV